MRRPKKNLKPLLLLSLLACSCAGQLPPKPVLELGVIDYPSNEVIVNMTSGIKLDGVSDLTYDNLSTNIIASGSRVPLSTYDRAVSFKPDQWAILQNYIDALKRAAQKNCK